MVRAFVAGVAGANCLARQHGVALRVLDLGVDDDLEDVPAEVSAYHLGPSQPIDQADALTADDCREALRAGEAIAEVEIAAGADLLIIGDMGIGNTTPAAALVGATFGLRAEEVVGRGSGVDDDRLRHKTQVIATALDRVGERAEDPFQRLAALGSADIAAGVGFLRAAARGGVPVLLDGIVSVAEACRGRGSRAWCGGVVRCRPPLHGAGPASWRSTSWAWNQFLILVCDSAKAPERSRRFRCCGRPSSCYASWPLLADLSSAS